MCEIVQVGQQVVDCESHSPGRCDGDLVLWSPAICTGCFYFFDNVHPIQHLSKYDVFSVQLNRDYHQLSAGSAKHGLTLTQLVTTVVMKN